MPAKRTSSSGRPTSTQSLIFAAIVVFLFIIVTIFTSKEPPATDQTPSGPGAPTATSAPSSGTTPGNTPAAPSAGMPGWLKVYFTNPNPPDDTQNGIDRFVVPALSSATQTIDVASFDLNLPSVVNALAEASQRGVKVRVVVDGENGNQELDANLSPDGKAFKALAIFKAAKIAVVNGGRSNGLMHNKMIIVDGKILFMGSWNMSYNDTFRNNNNLLQITDPTLIANYQAKFNELYQDKRFGTHAQVGAQKSSMTLDGVQVENYFSPVDQVMQKLVQYVQGGRKSIRFMAFTYTHPDLAAAMIARAKAGVDVKGVIENRGASQGALVPLFCAKLPVKVDGNKYTMHHKVIVIDDSIVVTGSFNFTASADTANDDNIVVIHSPAVAALYLQEFERVDAIAQSPNASEIDCSKTKQ